MRLAKVMYQLLAGVRFAIPRFRKSWVAVLSTMSGCRGILGTLLGPSALLGGHIFGGFSLAKIMCLTCNNLVQTSNFCQNCGAKLEVETPAQMQLENAAPKAHDEQKPGSSLVRKYVSLGTVGIVVLALVIVTTTVWAPSLLRNASQQAAISAAQEKVASLKYANDVLGRAQKALDNTGQYGGVDNERSMVATGMQDLQASVEKRDFTQMETLATALDKSSATLISANDVAKTTAEKAAADAAAAAAAAAAAEERARASAQFTVTSTSPNCFRSTQTGCIITLGLSNATSYPLSPGSAGTIAINGRSYQLRVLGCSGDGGYNCDSEVPSGGTTLLQFRVDGLPDYETLEIRNTKIGDRISTNLNYNWG